MRRIAAILLTILILAALVEATEERRTPIQIRADNAVWDKKNNFIILSGNVAITSKGMVLTASQVKAFGELDNLNRVIGEGGVKIVDTVNKVTIRGGYIEYDVDKEYGLITLNPILKREVDNLEVTSSRMEYFFKKKEAVATGKAEIHYRDLIAKSGKAIYNNAGRLILTEKPQIIRSENRFSGEKIIVYTKEERLEIIGNVKGIILSQRLRED